MGQKSSKISLSNEEKDYLTKIIKKGTIELQTYRRAKILLLKSQGLSNQCIANRMDVSIDVVVLCLKKYRDKGVNNALENAPGRGRKAEIFDEAKTWIVNIACQKPTAFGFAAELWYPTSLTNYIRSIAEKEGYPRLATISVSKVRTILREAKLNPHKVTYYCEKRDPDFDKKMHDVLVVYKQLEMRFDENGELIPFEDDETIIHTLSYDEKPGIQAIKTTTEDKPPVPNGEKTSTIMRDYEYVRGGTLSLLAAIDLLTGEAIPYVSDTHKSSDFINFLKKLDERYPKGDKIRLVLDNHSAHTSKETQEYINTIPGRFQFVFTPTHGSWLNMIEGFFSKMTRQMLKGIRVESKEELSDRIYMYFDEVNAIPVPYKWKYKMETINLEDEDIDSIVYEVVNAKAASKELSGKRAPKPIERKRNGGKKTETDNKKI